MASEPMSAERLAIVREWHAAGLRGRVSLKDLGELLAEIDRLRAEVASMQANHDRAWAELDALERERDEARAEVAALRREPGPLVPDAPGWWWWRGEATGGEWAPCAVGRVLGVTQSTLTCSEWGVPHADGEWGGRCEEPKR